MSFSFFEAIYGKAKQSVEIEVYCNPHPEIRAIPGYEGYWVTDDGRIRSSWVQCKGRNGKGGWILDLNCRRNLILQLDKQGYRTIQFNNRTRIGAHQLVLLAFVGPCPVGQETRHKNGIKIDNRLSNLEYGTCRQNHADKILHGTSPRGENSSHAKLTDDQVIDIRSRANYLGLGVDLAKEFNVSRSLISMIRASKIWGHI